jgi:hypothetical protein
MGGLCRHRARGILFAGALIVIVPFIHVGSPRDQSSSVVPTEAVRSAAIAEAPLVLPVLEHEGRQPEHPGLHLVVAD